MPEVVVLQCDAPACEEIGQLAQIEFDGQTYEVILCSHHAHLLVQITAWGRRSDTRTRTRRRAERDTSPRRLESLYRPA